MVKGFALKVSEQGKEKYLRTSNSFTTEKKRALSMDYKDVGKLITQLHDRQKRRMLPTRYSFFTEQPLTY